MFQYDGGGEEVVVKAPPWYLVGVPQMFDGGFYDRLPRNWYM